MSERRPKRRCVAAKTHVPSAIHYVGYVEDDETPEMIMKKFEELERIQKAAEARRQQQQRQEVVDTPAPDSAPPMSTGAGGSAAPDRPPAEQPSAGAAPPGADTGASAADSAGPAAASGAPAQAYTDGSAAAGHVAWLAPPDPQQQQERCTLDEEVLLEVFKQTSIFNVRSALSHNEFLMAGAGPGSGAGGPGGTGDDLGVGGAGGIAGGFGGRYDPFSVAYGMEDMLFVGGDGSDLEDEEAQYVKGFWSDEDYELGGGGGGGRDRGNRDGSGSRSKRRAGAGKGGAQRSDGGGGGGEGGGGGARQALRGAGGSSSSGGPRHAHAHQMVTQYNRDTNALIRRRVAAGSGGGVGGSGGGGGLVQLRVPPPPLPLSWGRTVRPYQPLEPYQPPCDLSGPGIQAPGACSAAGPSAPVPYPSASAVAAVVAAPADADAAGAATAAAAAAAATAAAATAAAAAAASRGFEYPDLASFPFDSALAGKTYVAVMVNMGWQPPAAAEAFEEGGEAEVMRRFRSLPIPRLCPRGFVLVWAHKGLLQAVCRALAGWGYVYVENLTWVHLTPANRIAGQPGRHFRRSHSTLLMFRREGEGRDIELRHQRNPDVVFDCIRCLPDGSGGGWGVPAEVLTTIETMLPAGRGAFLELWAPRGLRRPGWDHICEVRPTAERPPETVAAVATVRR